MGIYSYFAQNIFFLWKTYPLLRIFCSNKMIHTIAIENINDISWWLVHQCRMLESPLGIYVMDNYVFALSENAPSLLCSIRVKQDKHVSSAQTTPSTRIVFLLAHQTSWRKLWNTSSRQKNQMYIISVLFNAFYMNLSPPAWKLVLSFVQWFNREYASFLAISLTVIPIWGVILFLVILSS